MQAVEDAHSNLSGSSSGHHPSYRNPHDYQGYPPGTYPAQYHPQQQTFAPAPHNLYPEQQAYGNYPGDGGHDEFAATNLLLSPVDADPSDYRQRLERQMQQQQGYPQQPPQEQQPQQTGYKYNHPGSDDDEQQLLNDGGAAKSADNAASTDKLSTIREELDPDEVVAEIDGLLLWGSAWQD